MPSTCSGQRIAFAPQTVAEARYGALSADWGTARMERLSRLIARARVLPVDIDTIEAVAQLTVAVSRVEHEPALDAIAFALGLDTLRGARRPDESA
jgi:predicted nucleic acid-binding protein